MGIYGDALPHHRPRAIRNVGSLRQGRARIADRSKLDPFRRRARRVVNPSAWNNANAEYGASYPSWSPDGHKIAFIRTSYDDAWSLYVLDLQAQTEPYVLVRQSVAEHTSWSRDGSRIAFGYAPFRWGPPSHVIMIGVVTTGGSVTEAAQGFHPDWTPTGDLVFNQFTGPGTASNFLGSSMRILVSTSTQPLIPEAVAPARADYWDQDAAWER